MEDKFFKADAKQIVDMAFNGHLFKSEITRDDMNGFEELIGFLLQSRFDSYKKTEKLFESVRKKTNTGI